MADGQDPDCVNLREWFGKQYRITFDPAYDAKGRHRDKLDPWMMQITCQRGVIYPHGGTLLSVDVDGRPIIANQLAASGVCRLTQDGDHKKTLTFDVADFDVVAKIVKPRRPVTHVEAST